MLAAQKKKTVIYACYALLTALSFCHAENFGLRSGCSWAERLLYPFLHANIFHALANIYVLELCRRAEPLLFVLPCSYLIAVSYPLAGAAPVIGLSGIVYACMGHISARVRRKPRFHLIVAAYILLGLFFPSVAVWLHAYCYVLGIVHGYITQPLCEDR